MDPDLIARLKIQAIKENTAVSQLLSEITERYLDKATRKVERQEERDAES
ncbi:hypothetical protein D3A95_08485 [Thermosynechococcus sichuanensis E542]|uniref:Uncharacterized protein n=2 Tax=Thermosynechococcus TaxID=146785 RepID=A0A3B7MBU7_9CYAN|nr:hypothetical protein D3A95_08485 [Thermosynechococcus vestitus E542]